MKKFTLLLWVLFSPMILLSQITRTQSNPIISTDLNSRPWQDIRELMPENNYCIDAIAIHCGQTINGIIPFMLLKAKSDPLIALKALNMMYFIL